MMNNPKLNLIQVLHPAVVHPPSVDLEDVDSAFLIGQTELNLAVETTGTQ